MAKAILVREPYLVEIHDRKLLVAGVPHDGNVDLGHNDYPHPLAS